ncbi:MAG TPA: CAP-associated domain-containing protein [Tetragenococcus sp.]|nr:CAP-associated domain-containing protein [Tetragenococcus sp.]
MKKRALIFAGIFTLFIILLYLQPIWFPATSVDEADKEQPKIDPPATTLNYEPIQTAGFASWIGQSLAEFKKIYGEPDSSFPSGFGFMVQRFAVDDGLLEVNSKGNVIKSIKYLGGLEKSSAEPFYLGMTMAEVAKITMIYPNFTIDEGDKKVAFELTEDDMSFRPLVAFDNGSFAVLFFDQSKKKPTLYAIDYLDSDSLLKLAPYPVTAGESNNFKEDGKADWSMIDQKKKKYAMDLLQLLQEKRQKKAFSFQTDLQIATEQTLTKFLREKEDYLTTERMQNLQRIEKHQSGFFRLNKKEMDSLLKDVKFSDLSGILEVPVYDATFTMLSWYSNQSLYKKLWTSDGTVAIAFSKENVLVLQEKNDYQTKESGSH